MTELKDWLNSINLNKNNLMDEDPDNEREYTPFVINKIMSGHIDTVLFASEIPHGTGRSTPFFNSEKVNLLLAIATSII